ncbi:MAG: hypothetical protein R3352_03060 [Salinisphaeraceae bacterium]|nr:hypothetical protein [Salinisphaeraceae bacterium]
MSKRALVLGCGGVAGGAWSIAALHNLQNRLDWDAREAEVMIGTSVGAVLAALLGSGVSVDQLVACQRGEGDCRWDHDADTGGALPPWPRPSLTAAKLLARGLRGEVSVLTAACGIAPVGRFDMAPFRRLIDSVVPAGQWLKRDGIWLMAVDSETGERVAFGREDAPAAALNDAVCASYGVPAWCPPVEIAGRRYIDGGVASPTSADFLLDSNIEEVIVLAPMASSNPDNPRSPLARIERRVRRYMTQVVDSEVEALQAQGKQVTRIEPNAEDLQAIGYNMMDPKRRLRVFETALQTTA